MSSIRLTLAAALLTFGGVAVVSAQRPAPGRRPNAVGRPGANGMRNPLLRGMTLTDAEKANLQRVESQHAAQLKALREQYKPQNQEMRTARQRGDTAAMRAMFQKNQAEREQMRQLMLTQRNDVRGALSPANQAVFDANVAALEKHAKGKVGRASLRKIRG